MVPLMLVGTELAHVLAYRIVYPQVGVRLQVLAETGHGYLGLAPELLGIGGALVLVGLVSDLVASARRLPVRTPPPWAFALLPLAGFTSQEFLERWIALGGFPWWMVLQPTFPIGLLLQLPFGLAAYVVARVLLRVAREVGIVARGTTPPLVLQGEWILWPVLSVLPLRASALAAGHTGRGPPLLPTPLSSFR